MPQLPSDRTRYYGWTIAITLAITETISWGILYYAFTVFITPMANDLGWSRTELSGGFSLSLLVAGAMAFPVGTWIDRRGSRWLMTIGSILASLLVIAWSQVRDIQTFYLVWIGLGVCSAMILYEPAFAVIAQWFVRRRSTALAIITFAAGFASTIFIPLSDALLHAFGWRTGVLLLGIFLGCVTVPLHALVLRRRPQDLGLLPDGDSQIDPFASPVKNFSLGDALRNRFFWWLTLAFALSYIASSALRVHFISFLIDVGINSSTAALASGSIGIMQVAGRVIFAPLDTRFSARIMVTGVFALQAIAFVILFLGVSLPSVGVFVFIFGSAYGAQTLARASIIADLYGSASYGRISSVMSIFLTVAATSAPLGAALVYDHFKSYQPILVGIIVLSLVSTLIIAITTPPTLPSNALGKPKV